MRLQNPALLAALPVPHVTPAQLEPTAVAALGTAARLALLPRPSVILDLVPSLTVRSLCVTQALEVPPASVALLEHTAQVRLC